MRHNLSEVTELIKDRRTIYPEFFSTRKVHREQVELVLNNAIWAPSHGMTQPWRFKVFMEEGKDKLGNFFEEMYLKHVAAEKQNPLKLARMQNRPKAASAVIAICMKRQEEERISELDEIMAVAAAVQNMHLTCTAYGLAAFWSTPGFMKTDDMKEFLGLGEKDRCLGFFYLGYPENEWPKGRRKPIEYVTEWIQE
ncbi:Nitroreductase [Lishizhenia tianjinensis]|uniref:Putative NAD(P)H nitroreductase n=1 Tax=Lishizhenia tianjinensis TaxID=477690 RepID=A0A1I6Z0Q3_9FLAO|nr:nitroreductase [Lishizhenia tianjinensis]SFT56295.1 Nitroreductase [Lishizhenia tianjinensis]